jgi:hypothetical protein
MSGFKSRLVSGRSQRAGVLAGPGDVHGARPLHQHLVLPDRDG